MKTTRHEHPSFPVVLLVAYVLISLLFSCSMDTSDDLVELNLYTQNSSVKTLMPDGQSSVVSVSTYKVDIYRVENDSGRNFSDYYINSGTYGAASPTKAYTAAFSFTSTPSGTAHLPVGCYDVVAVGYDTNERIIASFKETVKLTSNTTINIVLGTTGLKGNFSFGITKDADLEDWSLSVTASGVTLVSLQDGSTIYGSSLSITGSDTVTISGTVPAGSHILYVPYTLTNSKNEQTISLTYQELVLVQAGEISYRKGSASLESCDPISVTQSVYYAVLFDGNGTAISVPQLSIGRGETKTLSSTGPTKENSTFVEWLYPWTTFGSSLTSVTAAYNQSEDITVYADWSDHATYAVVDNGTTCTLKLWMGSEKIISVTYTEDLTVEAPEGWTDSGGTLSNNSLTSYGFYTITFTGKYSKTESDVGTDNSITIGGNS